ncbi:MAG: hypothetical protein ABSD82_11910 [Solirubrobacteraceae bacterium]
MCATALRIAGLRRHRHQPDDLDRRATDEGVELVGCDSRLRLLAADVDLDQDLEALRRVPSKLAQRRVGGDRVDQFDVLDDQFDLA